LTKKMPNMKKYIEIIIHISVWTIGYILILKNVNTIGDFRKDTGPFWIPILLGTLMNLTVFYVTAFILVPNFLRQKRIITLILLLSGGFIAINLLESFIDYNWLVAHFSSERESFTSFLFYNSSISFFILLFALTYALIKYWIQNEKLKRELLEEKLTTEMAFLKSQINPHFLFNVLNSFYAKSLKHDVPELADGISKLAQLMRYMVYETNDDKVKLINEINHLKNFIEIYKLRLAKEDDVTIKLDVYSEIENVMLSPMLLIPFVENAIKHGIDPKEKSVISISITIKAKQLHFKVTNTIHQSPFELTNEHSGFGLDNLKKRLSVLYPNKHIVETKEEIGNFISLLILQLD